jgi:drug/metabolite transporter (DMT)-like permease
MDMRLHDSGGDMLNHNITAVIAGLLLGLGAFFLKLTLSGGISMNIIYSPYAWVTALLAVVGFLLMQKALQSYVSIVMPLITGVVIFVSVFLAAVFLAEDISAIKWLGIALILVGVFGLSR